MESLVKKINTLEYHNRLLLRIIEQPNHEFDKLVVKNSLSENEVKELMKVCEFMHIEVEEQKAEGLLYFHPLFQKFTSLLPRKLSAEEVVLACLKQKVYPELMKEFKKYIERP